MVNERIAETQKTTFLMTGTEHLVVGFGQKESQNNYLFYFVAERLSFNP